MIIAAALANGHARRRRTKREFSSVVENNQRQDDDADHPAGAGHARRADGPRDAQRGGLRPRRGGNRALVLPSIWHRHYHADGLYGLGPAHCLSLVSFTVVYVSYTARARSTKTRTAGGTR